ncbi:zinc transporter ZntB [Pseudoalteromonas sp. MMG010]|uniref:zinc transporter ZntB n=1 Tax=Pseudoalteromonas sp. MMG010 TaxID=2822685 RepID=UPI001B3A46E8|nr:zinc transporter ZntB [Pseudoalteromonas sp. MMG010]MBQ4832828.1 zinc transporter ZntB [Pseudoalteromonas sp. MMG010]
MLPGLLHALRLDESGGAVTLTTLEQLAPLQNTQGKLWLHIDYSEPQVIEWLKKCHFLSEYELTLLIAQETRPRVVNVNNGQLLFLRGVNLNPTQSPEDMVSLRFFINENIVITTRKRHLLSIQDTLTDLANNKGPKSISQLVCALTHNLIWRMQDVVDGLDEVLDLFEDEIDEPSKKFDNQGLSQLRRQAIALKRYLKPQKEALNNLLSHPYAWLNTDDKTKLNETTNLLIRYLEELENAIERAQIIQQTMATQVSEQLNQRMYVMSIVAAIFLPLGFLTGLLGVNIGGIPGTDTPYAFALFIAALILISAVIGFYLKFKKWL